MTDEIDIKLTPPDLIQRMRRYPEKLTEEMETTTRAALLHTQGSVPSYPPARPESSYVRTGTLGRSIGLNGRADIYEVRKIGAGYEARLGTRLEYAPPVIGSESQLPFFKRRGWWTMKIVLDKATPGIVRLYQAMGARMVHFLEGRR